MRERLQLDIKNTSQVYFVREVSLVLCSVLRIQFITGSGLFFFAFLAVYLFFAKYISASSITPSQ
jgi:hypothetical protein